MNTATLTKITVRDSRAALDNCVANFKANKELDVSDIAVAIQGINKEIQLRDYALGVLDTDLVRFWSAIGADKVDSAGLKCLLASAYYCEGNTSAAMDQLDQALRIDGTYTLTALLGRVFRAQWPAVTFANMRAELHPNVCKNLDDMAEDILTA